MNDLAGVSRETIERLEHYASLLRKWNAQINLVATSTLADLWTRHIADSAQIYQLALHPVRHWVDLGSGGGFPGLVIAIMGLESGSPETATLVESDARKCAFLRTVIRETGARAKVITNRIESTPELAADALSVRALSDLTSLMPHFVRHLSPQGTAFVLKGANWKKELEEAQTKWKFTYRLDKSMTQAGSVVLSIRGVSRA